MHDNLPDHHRQALDELARTYGDAAIITTADGHPALATASSIGLIIIRDATLAHTPEMHGWQAQLEDNTTTAGATAHGPTATAAAAALHDQLQTRRANGGEDCDECGAQLTPGGSLVQTAHAYSCSLHPANLN